MKKGLLIVNAFIELNKERFDILYEYLEKAFLNYDIELIRKTNAEILTQIDFSNKNEYEFVLFWDKDIMLAHHLENLGYKVFNSAKAIEICDDKAKTALILENKDILMPKTIFAPFTFSINPFNDNSDLSFVDEVIKKLSLPLVIKENNGSFGEQVYLVNTKEELIQKIKEISPKQFLFQEYIKSSFGRDCRIEVVGGKAIGAVQRRSNGNEFRSNVLQGGSMFKFDCPQEFYQMAEKVCKIIGLDFAGVDIMFKDDKTPIFCEVNSNVHFKTFYTVTGINLADEIAKYIVKKL